MKKLENLLSKVIFYDQMDKDYFVHIKSYPDALFDICNAINDIDDLVVINTYRACPPEYEMLDDGTQCVTTEFSYIDFFALENNYLLAEALCIYLTKSFGQICSRNCEVDDENEFAPIGVRYCYRIEFEDDYDSEFLIKRIAKEIRNFKELYL